MEELVQFLQAYPALLEILGIAGFLAYIISFQLVQTQHLNGNGILYSLLNILAAFLVLLSLATAFNLASFMIQISFMTVGIIGILLRIRRKAKLNNQNLKQSEKNTDSQILTQRLSNLHIRYQLETTTDDISPERTFSR